MAPVKNFRTHAELVELLAVRGMDVGDTGAAEALLRRFGYHRLGGYRYPFRTPLPAEQVDLAARTFRSDDYQPGTTLRDVLRLCEFDARLREICLSGLLEFEVRLRAAMAHVLAARSPMAHLEPAHLDRAACESRASEGTKFQAWTDTVDRAECRSADEDYAVHHRARGLGPHLPVWALIDLLDFGSLPYLLDLMQRDDVAQVSAAFGVRHRVSFVKWVRALSDLRNVCAHNQRLFNRVFKRAFVVRSRGMAPDLDHLVAPTPSGDPRKLPPIVLEPACAPLVEAGPAMGFPAGWDAMPLWAREPLLTR